MECWPTVDLCASREALDEQLAHWQHFYNQERTHAALGCKTPHERLQEVRALIPELETVHASYDPQKESYVSNNHYYWAPPDET